MTFSPNSAPDWFTPKYLNLATAPGQALDPAFEVVVAVVVVGGWTVVWVGGAVVAEEGMHWEYHSLTTEQANPASQSVGPE